MITHFERHPRQEQRRHLRHPVRLPATLYPARAAPLAAQVSDLCLGGLRMALAGTAGRLALGDQIDLSLRLEQRRDAPALLARIELVRQVEEGFGARFLYLDESARGRLAAFLTALEVDLAHSGQGILGQGGATAKRVLIEQTRAACERFLAPLFEDMVAGLWDAYEHAETNSVRVLISSEIGLIINASLSGALTERVRDSLLAECETIGVSASTLAATGRESEAERLALVETDSFETWLVKSEVATALERELKVPLRHLRAQTRTNLGGIALAIEPAPLLEILESCLRETGVGGPVLRQCLQCTEQPLGDHLAVLYAQLLDAWTTAGVRPADAPASAAGEDSDTADPDEVASANQAAASSAESASAPQVEAGVGDRDPVGAGSPRLAPAPAAAPASSPAPSPSPALRSGSRAGSPDPASDTAPADGAVLRALRSGRWSVAPPVLPGESSPASAATAAGVSPAAATGGTGWRPSSGSAAPSTAAHAASNTVSNRARGGAGPSGSAGDTGAPSRLGALLEALLPAEDAAAFDGEGAARLGRAARRVEPAVRQAWQRWLGTLDGAARQRLRGPRYRERADLTDRLLAQMQRDEAVTPDFKALLERLPLHFLAMALNRDGAVADSGHPLTEALDHLDQVARLMPNGERDDPERYQEFADLIARMAATDPHDEVALREAAEQLKTLEGRLAKTYRRRVTRWIELRESQDLERGVREQVREKLNAAFAGQSTHSILGEVLELGWRRLLESTLRRSGLDSQRWDRHWDPLWHLHRATTDPDETPTAPQERELLLDHLSQGLLALGVDPVTVGGLRDRIAAAIDAARERGAEGESYQVFAKIPPRPGDEPDARPEGIAAADWQALQQRVDAVPIGALIWMRDQQSLRAVRLIWRSDDGTRLALADPLGRKRIKQVRRSQLAKALARGRAQVQPGAAASVTQRAAAATLSALHEQLHDPASHDRLAALDTARELRRRVTLLRGGAAAGADRAPADVLLVIFEIDRFEVLSTTHGYAVGEQLLAGAADKVDAHVPTAFGMALLGHGRLGFLLPGADPNAALPLLDTLRLALKGVIAAGLEVAPRLSASLGVASLSDVGGEAESLLSAANLACLVAKQHGGDQVVIYRESDATIQHQLEQMRSWARCEAAIGAERHRLRCQPIVPVTRADSAVHHHEILLSVFDQDGAPLPLVDFIAAAEALSLMRQVDAQVVAATFKWLHEHPDEARSMGGVAINLSGQSVGDPALTTLVRDCFARWPVPSELIGFEVTETAAIADLDHAVRVLEELRALGCRISLDDFGSGLSSYGYLKRLPVDFVKIDGAFVKDITTSPEDREIVRSFNQIAHFMGKKTIAEFVENEAILAELREIGVDYAQGFGIQRPRFIDETARAA